MPLLPQAKGDQESCPQSATATGLDVLPDCEPTASILLTTSIPSVTIPKTTCLPSSQAVLTVQRKNWEPLVLGPAFAMERMPGPVCLSVKFSSANFEP
eukprot:CAMPEP_0185903476 /NCGR_PEP_ID=MMETSP0196C-20130402/2726_1 /TAXON_ID=2932 /ORGANISM="Alexandrium fundyense, Strain CCMP1719" /LENGTH=97 /DNA_ID=CAMNT_0028622539 /DNA_START=128 /DNA_END=421 /DNA_ORIENTATION=+